MAINNGNNNNLKNGSMLVIRNNRFSPPPTEMLQQAKKDKLVVHLSFRDLHWTNELSAVLEKLLLETTTSLPSSSSSSSLSPRHCREWESIRFHQCEFGPDIYVPTIIGNVFSTLVLANTCQLLSTFEHVLKSATTLHTLKLDALVLANRINNDNNSNNNNNNNNNGAASQQQQQQVETTSGNNNNRMQDIHSFFATGLGNNHSIQEIEVNNFRLGRQTNLNESQQINQDICVNASCLGIQNNTSLQRVRFTHCHWPDDSLNLLIHAIGNNNNNNQQSTNNNDNNYITTLNLQGNYASFNTLSSLSSSILLMNPTNQLQHLDLSDQNGYLSPIDSTLAIALQSPHCKLLTLNLARNKINDQDMKAISRALCTNETLCELNLSYNRISNAGIFEFGRCLPEMKQLQRVALRPNPFGNRGGKSVLKGMQRNYHVEYMDSLWTLQCANQVRYYCNLNRGGRRMILLVHDNNISSLLWPFVLHRADTISYFTDENQRQVQLTTLYYLLRNGNIHCVA